MPPVKLPNVEGDRTVFSEIAAVAATWDLGAGSGSDEVISGLGSWTGSGVGSHAIGSLEKIKLQNLRETFCLCTKVISFSYSSV